MASVERSCVAKFLLFQLFDFSSRLSSKSLVCSVSRVFEFLDKLCHAPCCARGCSALHWLNDFKADLYGLTALSISVARSALLKQWLAQIGSFFGFEIGNLKFAALHFRCRLISH